MKKMKMTEKDYVDKVKGINPHLKILSSFTDSTSKIKYSCSKCQCELENVASCLYIYKNYCPSCNNRIVVKGYNDCWTTNPEIAKLLLNPEDGYKYTKSCSKAVDWKCPDCGNIVKNKAFNTIFKQKKIPCRRCSDGLSIPSKFMANILSQLNINFKSEKTFDWCKYLYDNKECKGYYDFYFIVNGAEWLLECDGRQHKEAKEAKDVWNTDRIIFVDKKKDELASQNNIKVIRIDCETSELDFMKNNILKSNLSTIFDMSAIDFVLAYTQSLRSKCIETRNLWNSGVHNVSDICNKLQCCNETIRRYLRLWAKLGYCDYPKKRNKKPTVRIGCNKRNCVRIINIEDGQLFESVVQCSKFYNCNRKTIYSCLPLYNSDRDKDWRLKRRYKLEHYIESEHKNLVKENLITFPMNYCVREKLEWNKTEEKKNNQL